MMCARCVAPGPSIPRQFPGCIWPSAREPVKFGSSPWNIDYIQDRGTCFSTSTVWHIIILRASALSNKKLLAHSILGKLEYIHSLPSALGHQKLPEMSFPVFFQRSRTAPPPQKALRWSYRAETLKSLTLIWIISWFADQ